LRRPRVNPKVVFSPLRTLSAAVRICACCDFARRTDDANLDFMSEKLTLSRMQLTILCLLASAVFPSLSRAQAPVFEIEPARSSIKFHVKASVNIAGKFDKWDASLKFTSPDETTGDFQVTIQAASVDTGSGTKNNKLKDLFAVEQNPVITFKSTKFVQTDPETFEVDGDFTIRGVSNSEKLTLIVSGKGTGPGEIKGKMVFNRKDFGMNKETPFIKIADHVDVDFHLKEKRVSGPPQAFKQ